MDISNVKSWLNFDISVTADFIADNSWSATGNPTISTTNALSNNALQLDGDSWLSTTISFDTSNFTIDGFFYVNSADLTEKKRLISVNNGETVNFFSIDINTDGTISYWVNKNQNLSNANAGTKRTSASSVADGLHHFAFVKDSDVGFTLYIDGVRVGSYANTLNYINPINAFVLIGSASGGLYKFKGTVDEFRLNGGIALWTSNFTPPTASEYSTLTWQAEMDALRFIKTPSTAWRYNNKGEIDDLINTTTAVKLTNLPSTKSITGTAFYQTTTGIKIFDVPSAGEVWIKFDVYFNGSARWRVYDISTGVNNNITTGITAQTSGALSFFNRSTNVLQKDPSPYNIAWINELQTLILHMVADSANGLIEVYDPAQGLIGAYKGEVNNGVAFSNLYMQSDGSRTFFSNVIISNQPLWYNDSTESISINYNVDISRRIESALLILNDVSRNVYFAPNQLVVDAERILLVATINVNYNADCIRLVASNTALTGDVERHIISGLNINIDVQRIIGAPVSVSFDLNRTVINVPIWRYENIGVIDDLLNVDDSAVQLDVPLTQSWTGKAFYNGLTSSQGYNTEVKMFPIPDTDRIWIKFDVYRPVDLSVNRKNYGRFEVRDRIADNINNDLNGKSSFINTNNYNNGFLQFWDTVEVNALLANGINTRFIDEVDALKDNEKQTFIIHWQADTESGVFEVYTDDGGLVFSRYAMMHGGAPFKHINFSTASSDGLNSYFSNIVISNGKLDFDDNVSLSVSFFVDAQRETNVPITLLNDVERVLLSYTINIAYGLDTARVLSITETISCDAVRDISHDLPYNILAYFDTERKILPQIHFYIDVQRDLSGVIGFDAERKITCIVQYVIDTTRYLPYQLVVDGTETTVIPIAVNDAGLQSINIMISEQQVTDRVSFVHAGNCNIMDKIQGTYRDYVFELRIEETDRQGILQTCSCCSDIDELLYSQIAYTIPENKYEWSEDYLEMLGIVRQENPEEDIEAQPTTTTEEHLRTIAGILGKNLVYRGATFYSTADVKEQGGKTYASVISELIGWSSRLPHMEINAYFRGDTLYVIQRGYEANTVSLAGAKIANLRVNQKLVRTTWGSDVQSESTVDTFINNWQELEQEPYNPSEGGGTTTYNDDGLVETTTTESESEKTETTYYYDTGENGEKYLAYEESVKYEKDASGNWQEYDTVTTTHDRVSTTQSHIYAESDDGSIIGEVVSPNRFDDRATPYDLGHGGGGRGFIVLTDGQGNKYKCYSIKYYSEEMEKDTRTTYGLSLVDTSFPIYGEANLAYLTQQLMWLNRKTEETISMDVYDIDHVIGFDDKISYNGATYYLRSNTIWQDEHTVNKQSLTMVRWF